ncbi:hypothetical protein V6N12_017124 [Hibiscus sabdariffa]|uniref:O-fucosyltransferase family protein n=1 Tax=Hibiscus sabdariffa TaxID=183260 RepID=A0ABR2BCK2_9ROSI
MSEFQRLRCRVAYHALQFRPEIQILGRRMVERLRAWGQPFLAYHPDFAKMLIQARKEMGNGTKKRDGQILKNNLEVIFNDQVGLLLRAMGYPSKTIIYLAGSQTFGGQRLLIPLRAMFGNLLEGWYGWITETDKEPSPSPMDLRRQAHRLLWDALDYIVSVDADADAFFPGFNNDGSGWPDFSGLVMGQRLYERAASNLSTRQENFAALFNSIRDNMYHPKHEWTLSVKEHLSRSLSEEGLIRQSLLSKPNSFLSHPLPECSCKISSLETAKQIKGKDGRVLYGDEHECPKWMQSAGAVGG